MRSPPPPQECLFHLRDPTRLRLHWRLRGFGAAFQAQEPLHIFRGPRLLDNTNAWWYPAPCSPMGESVPD